MTNVVASSFRDPCGFLFLAAGELYRQVNASYRADYDALQESGLYAQLVDAGALVAHEEVAVSPVTDNAYKVIKPERIPMITYPYEWSFSQLKDAALLTLDIQRKALDRGLTLKDASAYNVQFRGARPVFIDTLSFERLVENQPWVAYKQFCEHFLAPLALMAKKDVSLGQLLRTNIGGVPLALASRLLPWRTRFSMSLGVHLHLHARTQRSNAAGGNAQTGKGHFSKTAFLGLVENLRTAVQRLRWIPAGTEWADYYEDNNNYTSASLGAKESIVEQFLQREPLSTTWDLGANTGRFSRLASRYSTLVCAWDIDPACVEMNYLQLRGNDSQCVLPLLLDLANPTPAIGWHNRERMSLAERAPADMVLALGLIHHLAISHNLPFVKIAQFLSDTAQRTIIEFVPKQDSQVQKLLQTRTDIFTDYDQAAFEDVFARYFSIEASQPIAGSERTLYLLRKR